jgi:hypothetical protein
MVIAIKVAVLAHALCIYHLVFVRAVSGERAPTIQVVTMITHALRIVLHLRVRASGHLFFRAGLLSNIVYPHLIYPESLNRFENGLNGILLLRTEGEILCQL